MYWIQPWEFFTKSLASFVGVLRSGGVWVHLCLVVCLPVFLFSFGTLLSIPAPFSCGLGSGLCLFCVEALDGFFILWFMLVFPVTPACVGFGYFHSWAQWAAVLAFRGDAVLRVGPLVFPSLALFFSAASLSSLPCSSLGLTFGPSWFAWSSFCTL